MATPEQCREQIQREYDRLIELALLGKINYCCIDARIESMARDAARHNGIPEYWRSICQREYLRWSKWTNIKLVTR